LGGIDGEEMAAEIQKVGVGGGEATRIRQRLFQKNGSLIELFKLKLKRKERTDFVGIGSPRNGDYSGGSENLDLSPDVSVGVRRGMGGGVSQRRKKGGGKTRRG
jgi:hypothetical protein